MEGLSDYAAVPVTRGQIVKEFADGDLAVRIIVANTDVDRFLQAFPEPGQAAFLSCEQGAIEATRDTLGGEYRDGSIAVRILIAPKDKEAFRRFWPRPNMAATLAAEDPRRGRQALMDAVTSEHHPLYGQLARSLRLWPNFVGNPKVWAAVGSDEEYLGWLRTQRCAHCTRAPRWEGNDYVPSQAAHVRRVANGAGTAHKPPYSAIPLCGTCHGIQHQYGEVELGGKEWFDQQRVKHVVQWIWDTLKTSLGFEHWNEVPPATLYAWAADYGLEETLPNGYRPRSERNPDGWV